MSIKSWNSQAIVNDIKLGSQQDAEVAVLEDGSFVVVWAEPDDFLSPVSISYQLFSREGEALGENLVVSPSTFGTTPGGINLADAFQRNPAVVSTPNGGFAIAIEMRSNGTNSYAQEIRFYDSRGVQTSFDTIGFDQVGIRSAELTLFRVGETTWSVGRSTDGNDDPLLAIYDSNNLRTFSTDNAFGDSFEVETSFNGTKLIGSDIAIVAYYNEDDSDVEFRRFDTNTNTFSGNFFNVASPDTDFAFPKVAALENGNFVISYTTLNQVSGTSSYDIAFQIYDAFGNRVSSETYANTITRFAQGDHDTVALPDGSFMTLWIDDAASVIYARTFGADGFPLSGQIIVAADVEGNSRDGKLDADMMQDGRVVVTWDSDSNLVNGFGGDNSEDVFVKIIDPRDGVVTGQISDAGTSEVQDVLLGSFENDVIMGLAGNDWLYGREDNDMIMGNSGDDILYGDEGDDQLFGNSGVDVLYGGVGDDVLDGGIDPDYLYGNEGDDKYLIRGDDDLVYENEGEGSDAVFASVNYSLQAGQHVELLRTMSNSSVQNIYLFGNELSQTIVGNAGNNSLNGTDGAPDVFRGLGGDDTYRVYSTEDKVYEAFGEGAADRVRTSVNYTLLEGQEIEFLTTNQFSGFDNLELTGNELSQVIIGNAGNNLLTDGLGELVDLEADIRLADTLVGGAGDDTFRVYTTGTEIVEQAAGGADRVFSSTDFVLNSEARVEWISTHYYRGSDSISLTGNEFGQRVVGNSGDNRLSGMGGRDTLRGSEGNDVFVFESAPIAGERDVIADFNPIDDQFELDRSVFSGLSTGTLPGFAFRANTTAVALDLNDRIMYNTDSGALFYDADGSGGGRAIQIAVLTANLALTADDFDVF